MYTIFCQLKWDKHKNSWYCESKYGYFEVQIDMKKYTWIIFVLMLAVGGYMLYTADDGEAKLRDTTNFAVENTQDIDKITLKDRDGTPVTLSKKEGIWYVNNSYKAFQIKVEKFLEQTLQKVRIKGPVPQKAQENVIRSMVGHSKHIVIYANNEVIRDYYVGNPTPDQTASYVHLKGSKTPYIAHILGFKGVIDPKFSCIAEEWYDRTIFDYQTEDIAKITVRNNELPSESFVLSRTDTTYTILPASGGLSQSAARSYFALFSFKNYEGFANYLEQETKDSIKATTPFMQIALTLTNGQTQTLNIHRKGGISDENTLVDKNGHVIAQDTERYFATFTGFDKLVTIQDYIFKKIITKRTFFGMQP